METLEVIVYIAIALILGALVIGFIGGWDATGTYDTLKRLFRPAPDTAYEKVTVDQFPRTVLQIWEACGLGSTALNKTVYVGDDLPLNKTFLFLKVKQANLCRTLQARSENCGEREDVIFTPLQAPVVVQLRCDPATSTLTISG
jgi:hypothetical protein